MVIDEEAPGAQLRYISERGSPNMYEKGNI